MQTTIHSSYAEIMRQQLEKILDVSDLVIKEHDHIKQKFENSETSRKQYRFLWPTEERSGNQYFGNVIVTFRKGGKQYGVSIRPEKILTKKKSSYQNWLTRGERSWLQYDENKFFDYLKGEVKKLNNNIL